MKYMRHLFMVLLLLSTHQVVAQEQGRVSAASMLVIDQVKVMSLSDGVDIRCADPLVNDDAWPVVAFNAIAQHSHLCMRVWIAAEEFSAIENPTLVMGALSAARIYWDGEPLASNGNVGEDASSEVPGNVQTLVRLPAVQSVPGSVGRDHLLSIEMSTFHVGAPLTSIAYALLIVDEHKLQNDILLISLVSVFLLGMLLTLASFFLLLYWRYYQDVAFLTFSLLCLSASLLLLAEQWKLWVFYSYDLHIYRLGIVYFLTFATSLFLPAFYLSYYRQQYKTKILLLIMGGLMSAGLLVAGAEGKSLWLFGIAILSSLLINVIAYKQRGPTVLLTVFLLVLGLFGVIYMPFIFAEFGFAGLLAVLMPVMLISLIGDMKRQRAQALVTNRVQTQLLKKNLQPHFLMNSLTHVMELIEVAPAKAIAFVDELAAEFRLLVRVSEQDFIPLAEEIRLCNIHLRIMSHRYMTHYQLSIVGDTGDVRVPSAILHSQIENSFTHNRISAERSFDLDINGHDGTICLQLRTPLEGGLGRSGSHKSARKSAHESTGIGDAYVRAKLRETCGVHWHFDSAQEGQDWLTIITYQVPEGVKT